MEGKGVKSRKKSHQGEVLPSVMVLKEANSRALAKEKQTKMADAKGETFALFLELAVL